MLTHKPCQTTRAPRHPRPTPVPARHPIQPKSDCTVTTATHARHTRKTSTKLGMHSTSGHRPSTPVKFKRAEVRPRLHRSSPPPLSQPPQRSRSPTHSSPLTGPRHLQFAPSSGAPRPLFPLGTRDESQSPAASIGLVSSDGMNGGAYRGGCSCMQCRTGFVFRVPRGRRGRAVLATVLG